MNVLIAMHHYFDLSGAETFAFTLARALAMKGCKVTIYAPYAGGIIAEKTMDSGIAVSNNLEHCDPREFDIINVSHNIIAYEMRFRFPLVPIVFLSHGVLPFLEQPPLDNLSISTYLAVSEEVRDNLMKNGVPEDRIMVFRNIVDTERFFPVAPIKISPQRALIISRKVDQQTKLVIEEACRILKIDLLHIGKSGNIVYEVENIINKVDVVFSLGRGILEAMSCGRASIVLDYNGGDGLVTPQNIAEIQTCNFSGRKFNKRFGVDELISEIQKYTKNLGEIGRGIILDRFAAKKNIDILLRIYNEAIDNFEYADLKIKKLSFITKLIIDTRRNVFEISRRHFEGRIRERNIQISRLQGRLREREAEIEGLRFALVEKERRVDGLHEWISLKDNQIYYHKTGVIEKGGSDR